jgi:DNA repair ATPase RecN
MRNRVKAARRLLDRRMAERDQLREYRSALIGQLEPAQNSLADHGQALAILTKVGMSYRKRAVERIESLVTAALEAVYETPYVFKILVEEKRGQVESGFVVYDPDTGLELDPATEMGGGIVDVVGLALRAVLWSKRKERTDATMIVDEPARNISNSSVEGRFAENLAVMLKRLHEILGIQFLVVTHREEIAALADSVLRVVRSGGTSTIITER